MSLQIASIKTAIGTLNLISEGKLLLGLNFSTPGWLIEGLDEGYIGEQVREVSRIAGITDRIRGYFDGDLTALSPIKVAQPGGAFSQAAWRVMRSVKPGKTLSYADLARSAGSPRAVRAAGSACAKNAIALVVPCHRIVATGAGLGGYAYGLAMKEWLLRHEGAL